MGFVASELAQDESVNETKVNRTREKDHFRALHIVKIIERRVENPIDGELS